MNRTAGDVIPADGDVEVFVHEGDDNAELLVADPAIISDVAMMHIDRRR